MQQVCISNITLQFTSYCIEYISGKTTGEKGYYFESEGPRPKKVTEGPEWLRYATGLCCVVTWHCAAVPRRHTTTDFQHVFMLSSSVGRNADSGRSVDLSFNTTRPSVSCGTPLELSAVLAASSPVTDDVQAPLKSRTVRVLLQLTVLLHYQHTCLSFNVVQCLRNGYSCLTSL